MTIKLRPKIISQLALAIFMLSLWAVLLLATPIAREPSDEQYLRDLSQAVEKTIQVEDVVFLASPEEKLRQKLIERQAKIISANPSANPYDYESFSTSLQQWLDQTCNLPNQNTGKSVYFLWTNQGRSTISDLGPIARLLIFFFSFQRSGVAKQFLQLSPRVAMITRYCQAKAIAGSQPVMVVVAAEEFQVTLLLGSVMIGNTIWLASNEKRKAWDSGWTGTAWTAINWSFPNHDSRGFTAGLKKITEQNGIILVDKHATLGTVAQKFLRSCAPNEITVTSDSFMQMCPNIFGLSQ